MKRIVAAAIAALAFSGVFAVGAGAASAVVVTGESVRITAGPR